MKQERHLSLVIESVVKRTARDSLCAVLVRFYQVIFHATMRPV